MESKAQEIIDKIATYPLVSTVVAICIIIIALSSFTNALEDILSVCKKAAKVFKLTEPEWKSDFNKIKRRIDHCALISEIPVHLHELRKLFIDHDIVKIPEGRIFFEKWLSDTAAYNGIETLDVHLSESVLILKEELNGLRL